MAESLAGLIKEIVQGMMQPSVVTCTVTREDPLLLQFSGDSVTQLDEDCLIVPDHVRGMAKGKIAYVSPTGDGTYIVLGTEDPDGS